MFYSTYIPKSLAVITSHCQRCCYTGTGSDQSQSSIQKRILYRLSGSREDSIRILLADFLFLHWQKMHSDWTTTGQQTSSCRAKLHSYIWKTRKGRSIHEQRAGQDFKNTVNKRTYLHPLNSQELGNMEGSRPSCSRLWNHGSCS